MPQSIRDFSKVRAHDGVIDFSLYQQDGSLQPMRCKDSFGNRMFFSWVQKYDSPTTGHDVESIARRRAETP